MVASHHFESIFVLVSLIFSDSPIVPVLLLGGSKSKVWKRSCRFEHDLTSGFVFGRYWELGTSFIFWVVSVLCNVNPIEPRQTDAFLGNAHFLSELGGILLLEFSTCYITQCWASTCSQIFYFFPCLAK